MTATTSFDERVQTILTKAEAARRGSRRDGDAERPLGSKARRTRGALLAAAYEQFTDRGYRATSVQQIHEAAGVSLGTFYLYFRDKSDVIAAIVGESVIASAGELFQPFSVGDDGALERVVERFIHNYAATADFQRVWEEVTHIDPFVASIRWQVTAMIDHGVATAIERGQAAGQLDQALDAASVAMALNAMVDRFCYRTFVVDGDRSDLAIDRAVKTLSGLWHRSLLGH